MQCQFPEVSDRGDKLVPSDPLLCPKEFVLKPHIGPAHECEVVWRKGTHVGVSYVSETTSVTELAVNERDAPIYAPDKVHERAILQEAVEQLILANKDREKSSAFIVISILNIIQITDMYGQNIDAILLDTALRLRACLRASDIIARLGDDSLGVVLPSFRNDGATVVANKIRMLSWRPATSIYGPIDIELGVECVLFPAQGALTAAEGMSGMQRETALARYANLTNS